MAEGLCRIISATYFVLDTYILYLHSARLDTFIAELNLTGKWPANILTQVQVR